MNTRDNYEDILHLPHHVSATRPRMSMLDRAAQFSPFAALTGHDAAIQETARFTDHKIEADEELLSILGAKLQILVDRLDERPTVTLTYFKPDARKSGGSYTSLTGTIKKIDDYERVITLEDGQKIPMDDVLDVEGAIFQGLL